MLEFVFNVLLVMQSTPPLCALALIVIEIETLVTTPACITMSINWHVCQWHRTECEFRVISI